MPLVAPQHLLHVMLGLAGAIASIAPASASPPPTSPESYSLADVYQIFQSARQITAASKLAVSVDAAPAIVSVLDRSDFEARGYRSVADALADIPGLFTVDELTTTNVSVRGIHGGVESWSRVIKVLINGHPATFEGLGGSLMGLSLIPLDVVARVEVIRGPASALYGANAFLGVVNIVTLDDAAGSFLRVTTEAGTIHNNRSGGVVAVGQVQGAKAGVHRSALTVALSSHYEDRSGIKPFGPAPRTAQFAQIASRNDISRPLSAFLHGHWGNETLGTLTLQGIYQRLDAYQEFGPTTVLSHKTRLQMANTLLKLGHEMDFWSDRLHLESYGALAQGEELPDQRFVPEDGTTQLLRERSNTTWMAGTELRYRVDESSVLVGADYSSGRHQGDTIWSDSVLNGIRRRDFVNQGSTLLYTNLGTYAQAVGRLADGFDVTAGLRYDASNVWNNSLSGRAAMTWAIKKNLSAKLLYGSSFVPPAPVLLTAQPVRRGGVQGSPTLQPQRAQTFELGIAHRPLQYLSIHTNVFVTLISDRVEYVPVSYNLAANNLTNSWSVGGEAILELVAAPFRLELNVSTNASGIGALTPAPTWFSNAYDSPNALRYALPSFPTYMGHLIGTVTLPDAMMQATASLHLFSGRNSTSSNSTFPTAAYALPSYGTVDVFMRTLGLHLSSGEQIALGLEVRNILGTRYNQAGALGLDIPNVGRRIFMRLGISL